MFWKARTFWAYALAFMLLVYPVGWMTSVQASYTQQNDCHSGDCNNLGAGSIVTMALFSVVVAWIVNSIFLEFQARRLERAKQASTPPDEVEIEDTHTTINIDQGNRDVPPEYDETDDGILSELDEEEELDCGSCSLVRIVSVEEAELAYHNTRIYTLDGEGKRADGGMNLRNPNRYGEQDIRNFQNLENAGLVQKGFTVALNTAYSRLIGYFREKDIKQEETIPCHHEDCECQLVRTGPVSFQPAELLEGVHTINTQETQRFEVNGTFYEIEVVYRLSGKAQRFSGHCMTQKEIEEEREMHKRGPDGSVG